MDPTDRVCMTCARAYPGVDTCPRHPDEVLLDPRRQDVLDLMEATELGRDGRITARWQTLGGFVAVPLACALAYVFWPQLSAVMSWTHTDSLAMFFRVLLVLIGVGVAVGGVIAARAHRPRYRRWLEAAGRGDPARGDG